MYSYRQSSCKIYCEVYGEGNLRMTFTNESAGVLDVKTSTKDWPEGRDLSHGGLLRYNGSLISGLTFFLEFYTLVVWSG